MNDFLVVFVSVTGSVLLAFMTATLQTRSYREQTRASLEAEYQRRTDEKKRDLYFRFTKTFREIMWQSKPAAVKTSINKQFMEFTIDLLLAGSDEVVETFLRWRDTALVAEGGGQDGATRFLSLAEFASLILAIRQDLGYSTTNLSERQVLASFINDLDQQTEFLRVLEQREAARHHRGRG
jgi:hypothetical protein